MATLYINVNNLNNTSTWSNTYYTDWVELKNDGYIHYDARSWAIIGYNTSKGGYYVGAVYIQMRAVKTQSSVDSYFSSTSNPSASFSGSWTAQGNWSFTRIVGGVVGNTWTFSPTDIPWSSPKTILRYDLNGNYLSPRNTYTDSTITGKFNTSLNLRYVQTKPSTKSESFTINVNVTISAKGAKKYKRTMTFNGNGAAITKRPTVEAEEGTTIYLSGTSVGTKPPENLPDKYYTISFNSQGGTAVSSIETSRQRGTRTFYHSGWKWSYNGNSYGTSASVSMPDANSTMTATWSSTDNYTGDTTIQYLPSTKPIKKGYIFSNWSYSATSNSQVNVGDRITKNTTVYAMYNPKTYKVNYNTTGLKFEEPNHRPLNFDKTYNANAILETNTAPSRIGYKFDGWVDNKGRVYKPGATFNDATYNEIADASTNPTITLSPKWSLINNTIKFHYYNSQTGTSEIVDTENYNIETESFSKGAPKNPMGGDYVFLGWTKTKPSNWTTQRGIYPIADQAPKYEMPVVVKNIQNIVDWGTTDNYYGFWTISGKYIKIDGKWRKSNMTYVKIEDKWRPVVNIYNKINGHWRPEVGRN